jgi:hypothetical protein
LEAFISIKSRGELKSKPFKIHDSLLKRIVFHVVSLSLGVVHSWVLGVNLTIPLVALLPHGWDSVVLGVIDFDVGLIVDSLKAWVATNSEDVAHDKDPLSNGRPKGLKFGLLLVEASIVEEVI